MKLNITTFTTFLKVYNNPSRLDTLRTDNCKCKRYLRATREHPHHKKKLLLSLSLSLVYGDQQKKMESNIRPLSSILLFLLLFFLFLLLLLLYYLLFLLLLLHRTPPLPWDSKLIIPWICKSKEQTNADILHANLAPQDHKRSDDNAAAHCWFVWD